MGKDFHIYLKKKLRALYKWIVSLVDVRIYRGYRLVAGGCVLSILPIIGNKCGKLFCPL